MSELQSGSRYIITNNKGRTAMDLSGEDNKSIIGYPRHGGENQQWELSHIDAGWVIKNVQSGHYLGFEEPARDANKLVATEKLFIWHIWHDLEATSDYRISVPGTNQDVDLSDYGNPNPGTPIATYGRWSALNQVWHFDKV